MKTLSSQSAESAHGLLDYRVVDQSGLEIGTVHSFWAEKQGGNLEFIGVSTGWLFGQNHVVPVDKVEVDEAERTVRVPYSADFVKGAPSYDADTEIIDADEQEIHRYYGVTSRSATSQTAMAAAKTTAAGATAYAAGAATAKVTAQDRDTVEVPLSEEQVRVGKRTVDAGQVRLRKIVRTEIVNQPVEIRHEEVVVERVSAAEVKAGTAGSNFAEEVIDVPLTREEVVVQKDAVVTGAVRVHKTSESETHQVSETVRKEDVEVLRDGKAVTERTDLRK